MSMVPWKRNAPVRPRSDFDRFFEDMFRDLTFSPSGLGSMAPFAGNDDFVPAISVKDDESHVTVTAELPGMKAEGLTVTVHDDVMTIKGEKQSESREDGESYYREERRFGSFVRQVGLPAAVDADHAEANMKDGVLVMRLPKVTPAQAKSVKIT